MSIDDAISNLVTRVKDLESSNTTLTSNYTTLNTKTATLTSDLGTSQIERLKTLVTAHYNGSIDISKYYSIGDKITGVPLKNGTDLDEVVDLVVIGVKHDTINGGSTKAALTLSQVNSLSSGRAMNSSISGYTYAKYSTSEMRTWINDTYYNALPSTLQNLIKTVDKTTAEPASSSERPTTTIISSTEKCFLPSNYEIFGNKFIYTTNSTTCGINVSDGTQYEYYKTKSNRLKYYGRIGTTFSRPWTRSGFVYWNNYACFVYEEQDGSATNYGNVVSNGYGVCPAFCI
jgi:hypothetical protein